MSNRLFEFESKKEKHLFFGMMLLLIIMGGVVLYPGISGYFHKEIAQKNLESQVVETRIQMGLEPAKTPEEYYDMFQCSCCGKSIDTNCCGMAKQRKEHLDNLLLQGLEEDEIAYKMVKKFGFDVLMDPSKEQEIRDYIKSNAPANPPVIEFDKFKHDFGTINQLDGVVTTLFNIKNTGGNDLVIENIDTSCMCTTARLIYDGKESPEFGMSMHGTNPENFELRIPAGETAQLKVFYDPMAHGVQDKSEMKITRYVTVVSNDPVDFQKKVRIELTQVK